MNFSGQHFLVLGLGESGLAMTQWLLRCGARVRVADTRNQPERLVILKEKFPTVPFFGGEFQADLLDSIDVVAVVKDERHRPREIIGRRGLIEKWEREILLANSEAHRFAIKYHRELRDKIR